MAEVKALIGAYDGTDLHLWLQGKPSRCTAGVFRDRICDDVMKGFPAGDPIYSNFRNYVISERQLAASRVPPLTSRHSPVPTQAQASVPDIEQQPSMPAVAQSQPSQPSDSSIPPHSAEMHPQFASSSQSQSDARNPNSVPPGRDAESVHLGIFGLDADQLLQVASGRKTVEGRINSGNIMHCKVGDTITFFNGTQESLCQVTGLAYYPSVIEMLRSEGVANCLPSAESLDEAVTIHHQSRNYEQRAAKHGVVALKIKPYSN